MAANKQLKVEIGAEDKTAAAFASVEAKMNGMVGSAKKAADAVKALGAAFAAKEFVGAVKWAIDYGSAINDAAFRSGLAVEAFQGLRGSAGLAGVKAEEFEKAMGKLNVKIGQASDSSSEAAKIFAKYGVSVKDVNGNVRGTQDVLGDFSDKVKGLSNVQEQGAAIAAVFGEKMGPKFVEFLTMGRSGMDASIAKFREMGGIISAEVIANADAAGDKLDAMATVVKAQLVDALVKLAPLLISTAQGITGIILEVGKFLNMLPGSETDPLDKLFGRISSTRTHIEELQALSNLGQKSSGLFSGNLNAMVNDWVFSKPDDIAATNTELAKQIRLLGTLEQQANDLAAKRRGAGGETPTAAAAPVAPTLTTAQLRAFQDQAAVMSQQIQEDINATNTAHSDSLEDMATLEKRRMRGITDDFAKLREGVEAQMEQNKTGWDQTLQDVADNTQRLAQNAEQAANVIVGGVNDILQGGIEGGLKGATQAFERFLANLALQFAESELQKQLSQMFQGAGVGTKGTGADIFKGLIGAASAYFGGAASGAAGVAAPSAGGFGFGPNAQGGTYMMGGNGAEQPIPLTAQRGEVVSITPKGKASEGKWGDTNININAPGASAEMEPRIRQMINQAIAKYAASTSEKSRRGH